MGQLTQIKF